ncbi:sensor histidine kinase [Hymenobacter lutimineralis]|nr:histidine kinase [Hymenobacter lutimineralis]
MRLLPADTRARASRFFATPGGRLLRHAAWWLLFVGFEYYVFRSFGQPPVVTWAFVLKDTVATIGSYYFFAEVLLPRILLRRRWLLTALGLVAIYYFWALCSYACYALLDRAGLISADLYSYAHRFLDGSLWAGVFSWRSVSMGLNDFAVTVVPPILLRFLRFVLHSSNHSLRLERENLHLEVNFLKAQVNPHFLFNTLNNLYMMVVKQDKRAPDMVQHLTQLLHYTVFESEAALVPLAREVEFLEAYLQLERLRYGQKVRIDYQQTGQLAAYRVTPLLFFPFVENAFKHGVDSSLDASWVAISLTAAEGWLHLEVRNSYSPQAPRREVGGVGIANVQKRLALHYLPQDYQLHLVQDPDTHTYHVVLALRLASAAAAVPAGASLLPISPTL